MAAIKPVGEAFAEIQAVAGSLGKPPIPTLDFSGFGMGFYDDCGDAPVPNAGL